MSWTEEQSDQKRAAVPSELPTRPAGSVSSDSVAKVTVRTALSLGVQKLIAANVDSPHLTAELLLGHVLGWSRVRILSYPRDIVAPGLFQEFVSLADRRAGGEPLQYMTGEQEFYGLRFRVTPDVLIPRSETELLVEEALGLAAGSRAGSLRFVDVGTGSGCIAISFAAAQPRAVGYAVDISAKALAVALENAARLKALDRILFAGSDLLECFSPKPQFDFVLCNPPYVALSERDALPAMVRDREPHLALFAGETGLEIFRRLMPQAAQRLKPGGHLLLEVGAGQSDSVSEMATGQGLAVRRILKDLQGISRCIVAQQASGRADG